MPESADDRLQRLALIGEIVSEGLQNGDVLAMQDGSIQITLECDDIGKSLEWLSILESLAFPPDD